MTEKVSLYNISTRIREIEDKIIASGGELTEMDESIMHSLALELKTKTDGVVDYIKSEESRVAEIDQRIKELTTLKKTKSNSLNRFKEYVASSMTVMKEKKLEGKFSSITLRNPSATLTILSEEKIPTDYITSEIVTKILKTEIKNALKSGVKIPGAKLEDGKQSLLIK